MGVREGGGAGGHGGWEGQGGGEGGFTSGACGGGGGGWVGGWLGSGGRKGKAGCGAQAAGSGWRCAAAGPGPHVAEHTIPRCDTGGYVNRHTFFTLGFGLQTFFTLFSDCFHMFFKFCSHFGLPSGQPAAHRPGPPANRPRPPPPGIRPGSPTPLKTNGFV